LAAWAQQAGCKYEREEEEDSKGGKGAPGTHHENSADWNEDRRTVAAVGGRTCQKLRQRRRVSLEAKNP
jgi:hypothetical protein